MLLEDDVDLILKRVAFDWIWMTSRTDYWCWMILECRCRSELEEEFLWLDRSIWIRISLIMELRHGRSWCEMTGEERFWGREAESDVKLADMHAWISRTFFCRGYCSYSNLQYFFSGICCSRSRILRLHLSGGVKVYELRVFKSMGFTSGNSCDIKNKLSTSSKLMKE